MELDGWGECKRERWMGNKRETDGEHKTWMDVERDGVKEMDRWRGVDGWREFDGWGRVGGMDRWGECG